MRIFGVVTAKNVAKKCSGSFVSAFNSGQHVAHFAELSRRINEHYGDDAARSRQRLERRFRVQNSRPAQVNQGLLNGEHSDPVGLDNR